MSDLRVRALELRNYRAFEHIEFDFDRELTVLIGNNGSGKTAVLDALCVMLSPWLRGLRLPATELRGFRSHDARRTAHDPIKGMPGILMQEAYPVLGRSWGTWNDESWVATRELRTETGKTTWGRDGQLEGWARDLRDRLSDPGADVVLPVICMYGTSRLWVNHRRTGKFATNRTSGYLHGLDAGSDLNRLLNWLRAQFYESQRSRLTDARDEGIEGRVEAIRIAVDRVMRPSGWTEFGFSFSEDTVVLRNRRHGELPLWMLSDGIRLMAGLVIDLTVRLARANPHLGGGELLERAGGICLIDEIDQHLHPEWQQQVVASLRKAFPAVQFIVTTHSPQVLSTVAPSHIREIEVGRSGDIAVRQVRHARGLRPDVVMRRLMGTEPEPRDTTERKKLRRYMRLVHQGKGSSETARKLRTELEESLGGPANVDELAEADARIALSEVLD